MHIRLTIYQPSTSEAPGKPLCDGESIRGSLAWISHRFATADADLREIPALRSVRVLDVPLRYACAPERSRALFFRHLRALANANR